MKDSEILYKAVEEIREHGWTRGGRGVLLEGPVCAMGAIGRAAGAEVKQAQIVPTLGDIADIDVPLTEVVMGVDYPWVESLPAYQAAVDVLKERMGLNGIKLWVWNDTHSRTEEDVIDLLLASAVICEAEEAKAEELVSA